MNRICEVFLWICRKNYFTSLILHIEKCLVLFNPHIPKFKPETQQLALKWAAVLCEQRFWLKDKHQCGPVSTGWSEMRPQLQKNPAGASEQLGTLRLQHPTRWNTFLLQPGGGAPSCLSKGGSRRWVRGWRRGRRGRRRGPPPFISSLQRFHHGGIVKRERAGRR